MIISYLPNQLSIYQPSHTIQNCRLRKGCHTDAAGGSTDQESKDSKNRCPKIIVHQDPYHLSHFQREKSRAERRMIDGIDSAGRIHSSEITICLDRRRLNWPRRETKVTHGSRCNHMVQPEGGCPT